MYKIPVCLVMFRRRDTMPRIMERIRAVQPQKMYLLSDEGRNEIERQEVAACRALVEQLIDWPCTVIKHYAKSNRGVYQNIGEGAKWVFEREETALFLEDDNLPEVTFFAFVEELLKKYENEPTIGWICGTNYLTEIQSSASYQFTQHLLPCGWASWGKKFLKLYDGLLDTYGEKQKRTSFRQSYDSRLLRWYQEQSVYNELFRYRKTGKFASWDYQMLWSIRSQNIYGIVPMRNQITNIGVDEYSIHGGISKKQIMTSRFCEVPSLPMQFPLRHPPAIAIDRSCEKILGDIILPPKMQVVRTVISSRMKMWLGENPSLSWRQILSKQR